MQDSICSIDGCEKRGGTRGWCSMHYRRWRLYGDASYTVYRNPDRPRPCPHCGETDRPKAGASRHCRDCWNEIRRERRAVKYALGPAECSECGQHIQSRWGGQKYCGHACYQRAERRRSGYLVDPEDVTCANADCLKQFSRTRRYQKFCTKECGAKDLYARQLGDDHWRSMHKIHGQAWLRANPGYHAIRNGRRRALLRAATVQDITSAQLESRFIGAGGRCWICKGEAGTWDHVKPLIAGGPHMLANLRPACQSCNSAKGGKWGGTRPA